VKVYVESVLDCPAIKIWHELLNSSSFVYIIEPLVYTKPVSPKQYPERWHEGLELVIKPYLFSFLPMPQKTIFMERVDEDALIMQTRETDAMVKMWDHAISVQCYGKGQTKYSDTIEIDAGMFTPLVWLFAKWFYRHRQNRWKKLALNLKNT
jgi:hypothetical protein